jgi:hypothetical protein
MVKRLSLQHRAEVLPALHGRPVPPVQHVAGTGVTLTFDHRTTRPRRFPVEQSLVRIPGAPRLGRFIDIEV